MTGRDATRVEAIVWCAEKRCDFVTPVFPPPDGWMWAESRGGLVLTKLFTSGGLADDDMEVTAFDVMRTPKADQ